MVIKGIDHVQLAMPRGEEAQARWFYGRLLGLRELVKLEPLASR
jgi:catechol 2,3-dioxygenase-like lactoylglutathione lyase family enzyme